MQAKDGFFKPGFVSCGMKRSDSPPSLTDLDRRLKEAQARQDKPSKAPPGSRLAGSSEGMGVGMRIASEIVAALAVGFGLGFALDSWLGTKPWLMILFIFLGFGAALVNVIRTAQELERKAAERRKAAEAEAGPQKGPPGNAKHDDGQ